MLHVYGIIDGPSLGAGMARGHGGRAVSVLAAGDVAAVVSPAGPAKVEPTPDNVWHHERLLGTLMARHAVLPMRFATTCDGDALARQLQARRQALRDGLRRVAGRVEIAVRISAVPLRTTDIDAGSGTSGRAYLSARMAHRRRAADRAARLAPAVRRLRDRIGRLSVDSVWHEAADGAPATKGSCLVARHRVAGFVDAVDSLAVGCPDLAVTCTGPWAPYSFVGDLTAPEGGTDGRA